MIAVSIVPRQFAHLIDALGLPYLDRVLGQHQTYFIVECEAGHDANVHLNGHAVMVNRYFPTIEAANAWIQQCRLLNDAPVGGVS